jgi:hypothetical protein
LVWAYDPKRRMVLPLSAIGPREQGATRQVLGWQELRPGDETTLDKIKALATGLRSESVIYLCSMLQLFMHSVRGPADDARRQQQIAFVHELFPDDLANEVVRRLQKGEADYVFHEEQLLLATALSIRYGQTGTRSAWDKQVGAEFLLRVTDSLGMPLDTQDDILGLVIRRLGAFTNEQERYLLPRYFDLMVTRARAKFGSPSPADLAFTSATGLSIEEYLALGFAYVGFFSGIRTVADLAQTGFDTIVGSLEAKMAKAPEARAVRDLMTAETTYYAAALPALARLDELPMASFAPFYDKPFVRVSNGSALPISLALAFQRLSMGIYWTIFEEVRRTQSGVVDINSLLGGLFQDYMTDALRGAYLRHTSGTFVAEKDIEGSGGQISCPDGVVAEGRAWISVEMTITSLTVKTLLNADAAAFRRELREDKFSKKFAQPVTGIQNIVSGKLTHPALTTNQVTDIFPVLLMLHPFPQFLNTWPEIDAVYTQPRKIHGPGGTIRIHRLQMLTAEEFEMLEQGVRHGAKLSDALLYKETRDLTRMMSMKNAILTSGIARENPNERMKDLLDGMADALKPILRPFLD